MTKAGITGGIGSGKTTVCSFFKDYGAYVLNADDLAKDIMVNDENVRNDIIQKFGEDSYRKDGSLNRRYLADQAFKKGRVEALNNIVHPRIPAAAEKIMSKAEKEGYEVFVYEAALLLQNLRPDELDYIILVIADEKKRIKRVQQRDDVAKDLVTDRIQQQQNFEELTHLADIIIRNNGTLSELEDEAKRIYYDILTNG